MNPIFLIIRGKQNAGKSTTAALLYSELLKRPECDPNHLFKDHTSPIFKLVSQNSLVPLGKGTYWDFAAILTLIVGGKTIRVAIISAGDIPNDLCNEIKDVLNQGLLIDFIVCCSRTINKKGSSYRMLQDNYNINAPQNQNKEFWINRTDEDDITKTNAAKLITVADIIKQIIP